MNPRRKRALVRIATLMLVAFSSRVPARADTASELQAARARLVALQSELNRLAAQYDAAQSRFAQTQTQIGAVQARISTVRRRMTSIQGLLARRARIAYETGGAGGTLALLLSSSSFTQFSNRIEYLGSIAQGDTDLLNQATVTREQLRRSRADLAVLASRQAGTIHTLQATRGAIDRKFTEQQNEVATLQQRFKAEQVAAARAAAQRAAALAAQRAAGASGPSSNGSGGSAPTLSGGALQACPVGQPRAFADDFGAPRPGGRTHQGIDMLAPLGTPIYAAQSGTFQANNNSLGGISALVYGPGGDYTYYAHMSAYAGIPSGASVSAGTQIGHVGNTGDAAGGPYHLHFEYHPGGGGAVDAYRLLVAVCG